MQTSSPLGTKVETIVGHNTQLGLTLPATARIPITVVGKSWIPVELITTNIIIARVATLSPLLNPFIAFMPYGVAALPMPIIFDAKFKHMFFSVSGAVFPKIFLTGRDKIDDNLWLSLQSSNTCINPIQTA